MLLVDQPHLLLSSSCSTQTHSFSIGGTILTHQSDITALKMLNKDIVPAIHSSRLEPQPPHTTATSPFSQPSRIPDTASRLTEHSSMNPSKLTSSNSNQVPNRGETHSRISNHEEPLDNEMGKSTESPQTFDPPEEETPLPCSHSWDRRLPPVNWDGILPSEYFEEAELDLHEKQEWIQRDVQALRELVQKEEGLRSRTDTAFLLTFLRARKFDYDKAFAMVVGYYKARQENQAFYNGLTATSLQHVWDKKLQTVLPQPDHNGRTVLIFRAGAWSPSQTSLDDLFRAQVLLLEHAVRAPLTQLRGVAAVVDCAGMGRTHAYHLTAAHIRRMVALVQEVFPVRFKALHFVHEPAMFEWMFSLVKPLLSETIRGRLHFHGNNEASLHQHIPRQHLPQELGGDQPPLDNTELVQILQAEDDFFMDHFSFGYTEPPARATSRSTSRRGSLASLTGVGVPKLSHGKRSPSLAANVPESATFTEGFDTCRADVRHSNADGLGVCDGHVGSGPANSATFLGSVADVGSFLGSYYRRMCIE